MQELGNLLKELGLPPLAIAATVIAAAILIFFLKRALNRREKRKVKSRETLKEYARLQEEALLKAYRMLYEQVDLGTLSQKEFLQVICQADDLLMKPFTRYRADLPAAVTATIYNDIHSVLAQFKPYPGLPREVPPEAIQKLSQYKEPFLRSIDTLRNVIGRYT
jgi:hypothetical protein